MVNGYTTQGFVINSNRVYGSVALLPRGMLSWKVCVLYYNLQGQVSLLLVYFLGGMLGRPDSGEFCSLLQNISKNRYEVI